jgi:hypothetical protein
MRVTHIWCRRVRTLFVRGRFTWTASATPLFGRQARPAARQYQCSARRAHPARRAGVRTQRAAGAAATMRSWHRAYSCEATRCGRAHRGNKA